MANVSTRQGDISFTEYMHKSECVTALNEIGLDIYGGISDLVALCKDAHSTGNAISTCL